LDTAADLIPSDRAAARLLAHQAVLAEDARPPVGDRLEALIGPQLARFLTAALSRRGYRGGDERSGT
jgi:hypothetical protein